MDIIVHMDDVVEFIRRRFPQDCNWLNGNCFFFAKILQSRFQNGIVLYDVIDGHFVLKIGDLMYDWRGLVEDDGQRHEYVEWDKFAEYDSLQKARITGICHVEDRELFKKAVLGGIGRGKAFGCGLLQVVPIQAV